MMTHCFKLICLACLLLLASGTPACAETPTRRGAAVVCAAGGGETPAPMVLAQSWGLGRWFSGKGGRTRVVQFCVVTMCLALFIMMRKLN